jgi:hypothetical protein
VKLSVEVASADAEADAVYPAEFQAIVEDGNSPNIIFKVDETGLYCKKLPSRNFITHKEWSASGFKAAKDRLVLLLGANVSGTLELPAQHRPRLSCSTPPPHQNLQSQLLHNMQTEEHKPPCVPKTGPHL